MSDLEYGFEYRECPFCLGEDLLAVREIRDDGQYFVVMCQGCKAEGPLMKTEEAARIRWNSTFATSDRSPV